MSPRKRDAIGPESVGGDAGSVHEVAAHLVNLALDHRHDVGEDQPTFLIDLIDGLSGAAGAKFDFKLLPQDHG